MARLVVPFLMEATDRSFATSMNDLQGGMILQASSHRTTNIVHVYHVGDRLTLLDRLATVDMFPCIVSCTITIKKTGGEAKVCKTTVKCSIHRSS